MNQQTNLIEPELRRVSEWLTAESLAIATAVTIAVIGGATLWATVRSDNQERMATQKVATLMSSRDELATMDKRIAESKPNTELANQLADSLALLKSHVETVQAIEAGVIGGTAGFAEFMRGFARQTPSGLWLTGFTIGAAEDDLEVRGRMTNPSALTEYIRRLKSEPVFAGRSFAALAIDKSADPRDAKALPAGPNAAKDSPPGFISFVLTPTSPEEIAATALSESLKKTRLASTRESGPQRAGAAGRSYVDPVLTPDTENLGKAAMQELAKGNGEQARLAALKKMRELLPTERRL